MTNPDRNVLSPNLDLSRTTLLVVRCVERRNESRARWELRMRYRVVKENMLARERSAAVHPPPTGPTSRPSVKLSVLAMFRQAW